MRFLNNFKLIIKLAIPATIFVAITLGLVVIAERGLSEHSKNSSFIDLDREDGELKVPAVSPLQEQSPR